MSKAVTNSDWELCLRAVQALSRGECRELESDQGKTLLNSIHRKLRKAARRSGESRATRTSISREPACIPTLRLLAMSAENRQIAVASSNLRAVLRKLRREIRLDLRSEPSSNRSHPWSEAEQARVLAALRAAKDAPEDIPQPFRAELASRIHAAWRQARRTARRRKMPSRKLNPKDCLTCEQELARLCDGLPADGDYRVFKGLLAKVERAFEKDIHQGRSSAEERRPHKAEDGGSSPPGPDLVKKAAPRPSLLARFFQWIRPR